MVCGAVATIAAPAPAQRGEAATAPRVSTSAGAAAAERDHPLKAVQLLEYRPLGADARVRFEWRQVPGVREYRLVGRWTGTVSWTVRTRAYRVTSRTATTWTPQRATLEVSLPAGNHSWQLVAVFGPNESTPLSFAVK